ncbi:MAG: FAD:protein FMN transferase [Gammaproteobacteria bacterium]|nr:FAD:protein FMN transferase [Gammaproteobacteria bacterium]
MKKIISFTITVFALLSCSSSEEPIRLTGQTMGTTYSIVISDPADISATALQREVDQRLLEINESMSTWIEDSELSRFNQSTSTDWFEISKDFYDVLSLSLDISQQTDGNFDVTVGPLVNLWGFGPKSTSANRVPSEAEITQAKMHVGFKYLSLAQSPYRIKKDNPAVYVDLSAVAKGYGVDQIATLVESKGVDSYLIEIGGEMATRGQSPRGTPWRLGIERPDANLRAVIQQFEISEANMATSGDYRNYFEIDGKRFSHTLNISTGYPIDHRLASITVLADNTATADAYATAMMSMGETVGLEYAERAGISVLMIIRLDDGTFEQRATGQFLEKMGTQ